LWVARRQGSVKVIARRKGSVKVIVIMQHPASIVVLHSCCMATHLKQKEPQSFCRA
jgi:hypothetical protein